MTVSSILDSLEQDDQRFRDPIEDVYLNPLLIADPAPLPDKDVCLLKTFSTHGVFVLYTLYGPLYLTFNPAIYILLPSYLAPN